MFNINTMKQKRELTELGFGVAIETIETDSAKIHNLKSNKNDVCNLGVRFNR